MKGFATKKIPGTIVGLKSYSTLGSLNRLRYSKQNVFMTRAWLSLPAHKVVPMPSLSPTMESGSIAKWNLKVGDKFEPGSSLCDVETDKATVSFDATDDGYLAKILISSGEIKVGQPLIVTVDEAADVAAFANFTLDAASSSSAPAQSKPQPAAVAAPIAPVTPQPTPSAPSSSSDKIFASPLAKKMVRESNANLSEIKTVLGNGSGPNGRIVAADVLKAASLPKATPVQAAAPVKAEAPKQASAPAAPKAAPSIGNETYADFQLSEVAQELAARLYHSKQIIPHYYVSVEINLTELLKLRQQLNAKLFANKKPVKGEEDKADKGISAFDLLIKAAALSMRQVPDVNASWMDTFIRRYEQVDINVVMGSGSLLATPVLKDVASRGVLSISDELADYESTLGSNDSAKIDAFLQKSTSIGTFSIHNLGVYGVKSAAPIVLAPQSAALSLGAIVDTVIPKAAPGADGVDWEVAPIMVATLSNDHRVIDGSIAAQWLASFKQLVENPMNLIL